jgi:hypothetical protein
MVDNTFQYPTNKNVDRHVLARELGAEQGGIKNGEFKLDLVPLSAISTQRERVVRTVTEVNFDKAD